MLVMLDADSQDDALVGAEETQAEREKRERIANAKKHIAVARANLSKNRRGGK